MGLETRRHCLGVLEGRGGIYPYSLVSCAYFLKLKDTAYLSLGNHLAIVAAWQ